MSSTSSSDLTKPELIALAGTIRHLNDGLIAD